MFDNKNASFIPPFTDFSFYSLHLKDFFVGKKSTESILPYYFGPALDSNNLRCHVDGNP